MMKDLARNIRIFSSQIGDLSVSEALHLILDSLFKWNHILIYSKGLEFNEKVQTYFELESSIIKGQSEDIKQIRKDMRRPNWEFRCDLYDGVKDFFIYKRNGAVGHISWIYYKGDPNRIIKLSDDEGEIKHCLTLPEFRGKGIYPATLIQIQKYLRSKGYHRVFICVNDDNLASIKGIEKAGFEHMAKVNLVKLFGIQISRRYVAGH